MKNIYLIVGESGAGKSTIADTLERQHGLKQLHSYTTRPMRSRKEGGHEFISIGEFDHLEGVVAYTEFCGYRYCATQSQVDQADTYIIDPIGIRYFKDHYNGAKGVRVLYIHTPESVRKQRMYSRGDDKLDVGKRLANDKIEFEGVLDMADQCFCNREVEQCTEDIYRYIQTCEEVS